MWCKGKSINYKATVKLLICCYSLICGGITLLGIMQHKAAFFEIEREKTLLFDVIIDMIEV